MQIACHFQSHQGSLHGRRPRNLSTRLRFARARRPTLMSASRSFRNFSRHLLQARRRRTPTTRLRYAHAHRQEMMTGAATTTAPTTAQLQMLTKNALAPTTVTLRTAATGRRSNSQAVRAHDCTRRVYATYACAAHNAKLLGEDANFGAKSDLVFIRDVKSGDEAGRRLQGSEVPRQLQTFLL